MSESTAKPKAKGKISKASLKLLPCMYTPVMRKIFPPDSSSPNFSYGPWVRINPNISSLEISEIQHLIKRWSLLRDDVEYSIVKLVPTPL